MGIVMALIMFAGAIVLLKKVPLNGQDASLRALTKKPIAAALLLGGLWNSVWYGLRHLGQFWGYAGLITGIIMIAAAWFLLTRVTDDGTYKSLRVGLGFALAISFALYFVTIVQLNLGYDYIQ